MRYLLPFLICLLCFSACTVQKATKKYCSCFQPAVEFNNRVISATEEEKKQLMEEGIKVIHATRDCSNEFAAQFEEQMQDMEFRAKLVSRMKKECPEARQLMEEMMGGKR